MRKIYNLFLFPTRQTEVAKIQVQNIFELYKNLKKQGLIMLLIKNYLYPQKKVVKLKIAQ